MFNFILICPEFITFHLAVRCAVRWHNPRYRLNYVSMALIISSFGKMLLILMVIWDYKQLEYSWLVSIIVLASNVEALSGRQTNMLAYSNVTLICFM